MNVPPTFRALCLCAALIGLTACGGDEQAQNRGSDERPVNILAHEIVLKSDTQPVEAVGTARAQQAATIYPEATGEVVEIRFTSGQYVEKGQVLAVLDSAEERLEVAQANVALKDAQQLLDRYERIDVEGAISESQIDAARIAVEAAEIQLGLARESLGERTIRAPFSGYVGLSEIDAGAQVNPQTELTRLDNRAVLFVDFDVPEQVFGLISEGDILPMQPFAASPDPVDATVQVIDSRIDPQRRTFTVRAMVENDEDRLRPGMSFRVNFDLPGDPYPAVPEAAIVWGGDGAYLWAVRDGQATRLPVTIVSRKQGEVLVRAPLSEGDLIVAEGVQKVREGTPVNNIAGQRSQVSSGMSGNTAGGQNE